MTQANSGTTLVLIHGWSLGSGVWETFTKCLPTDWQIQTLDLPGYGSALNDLCGSTDIEAIVAQIIDKIPAGAILVGWSLGGMVAIKLAECLGDKLSGLILLASTPCFSRRSDWPHGVEGSLLQDMARNLSNDRSKVMQSFITEISLGDPSPRDTIRHLRKIFPNDTVSLDTLSQGLQILSLVDLRTNIATLTCPVALILGRNDRLITCSTEQAIQSISPQTELFIIEDAGHVPFISQQDKTAQAVNAFVETLQ